MNIVKKLYSVLLCAVVFLGFNAQAADLQDVRITMTTTKGDINITLYSSKAPVTVANFLNLIQKGFYNGLTFHRVIADFMIQGGDPTGTGRGGTPYSFEDEFCPELKHKGPGVLSMANCGPNTNGSQFFITHVATPHLDGRHTVFGQVTKGQKVVDAIQKGDKILKVHISDKAAAKEVLKANAARVAEWNRKLTQFR